jgi:hypothetical protein
MTRSVPWEPQDPKEDGRGPQLVAIQHAYVEELFFGGAVGGGKTDYLLGDFGMDVAEQGPDWQGILFRTSYPQIEAVIERSLEIYPKWFPGVVWKAGTKTWEWPNGAFLRMRFLADDTSWLEYQGHRYAWIGFDELPQWATPINYKRMKARLRGPAKFKRMRGTGNPGGAGHAWIKSHFKINEHPDGGVIFREGSDRRMFIRSRLQDNKILLDSDPGYLARLDGLGSPELIKAWKEGDWNVTLGSFFPEFDEQRHVVRPFLIPSHWTRGRAMDWGSAKPYCVLWFAVASEDTVVIGKWGNKFQIPRGCLVFYRELYGVKELPNGSFEPNEGTKEPARTVGRKIVAREFGDIIEIAVLDPASWNVISGPSIAEQIADGGAQFSKADNTRTARKGAMSGWNMVRERLVGDDEWEARPMLVFMTNCEHTLRTLPVMQHDKHNVEDMDSTGEDHPVDTVRYACNSRPFSRKGPNGYNPLAPENLRREPTIDQIVAKHRRARLNGDTLA